MPPAPALPGGVGGRGVGGERLPPGERSFVLGDRSFGERVGGDDHAGSRPPPSPATDHKILPLTEHPKYQSPPTARRDGDDGGQKTIPQLTCSVCLKANCAHFYCLLCSNATRPIFANSVGHTQMHSRSIPIQTSN